MSPPNVQEGNFSVRVLAYFDKLFPPGSLRGPTIKGGVWTLVSLSLTGLLGVGSGVVLARLLTPEIFGLVGVALATVAIWDGLTNPGVWQALIQRSDNVEPYLDTAWTLQVGRGVLLCCLTFFGAPWLAAFYNNNELIPLLRVLSVTFLMRGASNLSMVELNRDMRFRRLALYNQITGFVSICIQVILVVLLRNAWALALGAVSSSLIRCVGSYVVIPRLNRFGWEWAKALPLLHFGKYIWGSSLVFFLLSWGDRVFIGRMVGEKELGFYVFALSLAYIFSGPRWRFYPMRD
ncbi:MAG: oligosaccharide flippase family protein [Deltaproteobacteria bacterium]|nr:oligosaccharide flippase family protein [Deltaproteobacteria bacterium]